VIASVEHWGAVIGAIFAGIGGLITAWAGLTRARGEAEDECEEKLKAVRLELNSQQMSCTICG
jgi:hypothetical protein